MLWVAVEFKQCHLQDESFAVFTDIDPAAEHHLQVIPKRHIGIDTLAYTSTSALTTLHEADVKALRAQDVQMGALVQLPCSKG